MPHPTRLAAALLALPALLAAQDAPPCTVPPYRGATTAEGALAVVTMANRGQACRLPVFGSPGDRSGPASSGRILVAPKSGTASFDPPNASYRPNPGYAGTDAFEFEAFAPDRSGRSVRLYVRVQVTVTSDR